MILLDHINLTVSSINESITWYNNLFKFEVVESGLFCERPYTIIKSSDIMLCLYEVENDSAPSASKAHRIYHFGLRIDDPEELKSKLLKYDIKVHSFREYIHSTSWYITDPTGYEIDISYWKDGKVKFPNHLKD